MAYGFDSPILGLLNGSSAGASAAASSFDPYEAVRALGSQFNDDGSGYQVTKNGRKIKIYGPNLNSIPWAQSSYGLPINISFGTRRLKGNLIWTGVVQEFINE